MPTPIQSPGGYAASRAMAFADPVGDGVLVSAADPLPVTLGSAATAALAGSTAASTVLGPYQPALGRGVMLTLSGSWSGTVKLLRSVDGGVTKLALTIAGASWGQFTANACEPVWEESEAAARLWLDVTLVSGTLTYRIAQ